LRLEASYDALRRSLATRDVRRVETSWGGCITGEWALQVGLVVAAYRSGGVLAVGVMSIVRTIPAAVVGPFIAAATDRWRRSSVLVFVLMSRALLAAIAGALLLGGAPLGTVYGVAAVDALVYTLWWPAHSALLPQIVDDPAVLTASNVTTTVLENLGAVAGPALAAVLILIGRPSAVLELAAVIFAVSLLPLVGLRTPLLAPAGSEPIWAELTAGFRTLRREREVRTVVVVYLLQTLCVGAITALVVVISVDLAHGGTAGIGWLNAVIGGGGAVGAFASLALVGRPRLGAALALAFLVWGAAFGLVAGVPGVITAVVGLAVVGACNAVIDVAALTLLQRLVDERVLGRVLGVFEGLWWAMLGLGALAGSHLANTVSARTAVGATACILPATAVLASLALQRVDGAAHVAAGTEALSRVKMFAALPAPQLEALARAAVLQSVPAGTIVIRRGDPGEEAFVVVSGRLWVDAPERQVELVPYDVFGEIALLHDVPRTATVTALVDVTLLSLHRSAFVPAVTGTPDVRTAAQALADKRLSR
jgi:hypothetical protein